MIHRLAAALAGAAVLGLPATAAGAPALAALKPCYVSVGVDARTGDTITEEVELAGTGFTPGSMVNIVVDGNTVATNVPVDSAGALPAGTTVKAPLQERGERAFTITVAEQQNAAQTVSVQTMVTNLTVKVRPKRAHPTDRVTVEGRGFTRPDRSVWAHYVRGRKERRAVKLAAASTGPCGTFTTRITQFPFKRPRVGRWILQIDQQRRYSPAPGTAFVKLEIFVKGRLPLGG
jgi:hypothetical protein